MLVTCPVFLCVRHPAASSWQRRLARESKVGLGVDWLTKTRDFVDLCLRASEGTTNRVRLKEDRFLALEIPLPPLAGQRRRRRRR